MDAASSSSFALAPWIPSTDMHCWYALLICLFLIRPLTSRILRLISTCSLDIVSGGRGQTAQHMQIHRHPSQFCKPIPLWNRIWYDVFFFLLFFNGNRANPCCMQQKNTMTWSNGCPASRPSKKKQRCAVLPTEKETCFQGSPGREAKAKTFLHCRAMQWLTQV